MPVTRASEVIVTSKAMGNGQKNITIKKVFGDKEPKDLSLEECKKAVAGKIKAKTKPKKKTTKK
ncbi:DNA topoisomerase I (EC [uncultured Gammaproteobacteria bacterium]|nr:DNA topoisomerase I (EC [uncultured Gammaproteobacteria bacterium]